MNHEVAAVVLAAGAGTRLRPLTDLRPKALCPVGNVALVDLAIERAQSLVGAPNPPARNAADAIAVNVHHGRDLMEAHLAGRVHLSIEEPEALGTAGALGRLKDWVGGRAAVVLNADAWSAARPFPLMDGWDGTSVRLLVIEDRARPDFDGRWRFIGASLMPWSAVEALPDERAGLLDTVWLPMRARGLLELIPVNTTFFDCGTHADYLAANMASSGGASVVGPGALVAGRLTASVVWPGSVVERGEHLIGAIRAGPHTIVPGARSPAA